jgi:hypothetical protein
MPDGLSADVERRILLYNSSTFVFLVAFYYLNTQLLIPKLMFRKKWWLYGVVILLFVVAFAYVPREVATWLNGGEPIFQARNIQRPRVDSSLIDTLKNGIENRVRRSGRRSPGPKFYPGSYAIFFLVYAIGTSIAVTQRWLKAEQQHKAVENEKLSTELSFLKSQINPHFFFNTLNNIYSLAIIQSDQTAPAVLKLSAIMRYILTETKQDWVPLSKEIKFISNYIELQQVRLTDKVSITFSINGETEQVMVAPLIFIPFIENAFKYGISTREKTAIAITLEVKNGAIDFTVTNPITATQIDPAEKTGIGLQNTRRRLELLYPESHSLAIENRNNIYSVHLILKHP